MTMKRIVAILFVAACVMPLTGCISRRSDGGIGPYAAALTEENSREVTDDRGVFAIDLPNEYEMAIEMEDSGARLFTVNKKETDPPEKVMYLEESPAAIEQALSMFENEETVTVTGNEDVAINGYTGKKISVNLSYASEPLYYYFIRAENKTYVFSQSGGAEWEYFEPVVRSFRLTQ